MRSIRGVWQTAGNALRQRTKHSAIARQAGVGGMQPCRGITWWAHRDDVGRGGSPFAPFPKTHRIGRPLCLENPRPEGAEYLLAESAPPKHIGSVDPYALKIPAPKGRNTY